MSTFAYLQHTSKAEQARLAIARAEYKHIADYRKEHNLGPLPDPSSAQQIPKRKSAPKKIVDKVKGLFRSRKEGEEMAEEDKEEVEGREGKGVLEEAREELMAKLCAGERKKGEEDVGVEEKEDITALPQFPVTPGKKF
jgi:hypothetical protein